MADLCPKCGVKPKPENQRWCSPCRKGRTKGERGSVPRENGRTKSCPNCEVLAAEVAALKRQLATKVAAGGAGPVPVVSAQRVTVGACGHGMNCQLIACRGARAR